MKNIVHASFLIVSTLLLVVLATFSHTRSIVVPHISEISQNIAAVFLAPSITVSDLQTRYNTKKVSVLIVPGHEPHYGGAEYKNIKERDMAVELADQLADYMTNNSHYIVTIARTKDAWNPELQTYFDTHWDDIISFKDTQKAEMASLISQGTIKRVDNQVFHNAAKTDVATRLFGINKWANDANIDITIHIHFNDYPRRSLRRPGDYSGFTIYVPEKQYSNAGATKVIADNVFKRLSGIFAISNLPKEDDGVVEDQDLIAIGQSNTANSASMLIEYGYMYEAQFQDPVVRAAVLKEMALQTYLGVQDFFGGQNDTGLVYNTTILPYQWKKVVSKDSRDRYSALALQTALVHEGLYPADGASKHDCPLTGTLGPCTLKALADFQKKYDIDGEKGIVGPKTRATLNGLYGSF